MIGDLGLTNLGINLDWKLATLLIWELVWKAFALYRAGKKQQPWWFFFILVLNTAGILPIIYLIISQDKKVVSIKKRRK